MLEINRQIDQMLGTKQVYLVVIMVETQVIDFLFKM